MTSPFPSALRAAQIANRFWIEIIDRPLGWRFCRFVQRIAFTWTLWRKVPGMSIRQAAIYPYGDGGWSPTPWGAGRLDALNEMGYMGISERPFISRCRATTGSSWSMFGDAEEINGDGRCPTYLWRWTILRTRWGKLYLHKFVGDDWSLDLHDHPKRFISIGIRGSYQEETPAGKRRWDAPWIRWFPAVHRHRISTPWGHCWTLVWVGRVVRDWGFWHEGQFYQWRDYVWGKDRAIADKMKACD